MRDNYDIIVLGSGIAGSVAALALSQAGLKTLVVEHGTHPRFAIGESMIPTTTLGFYQLADRYNIPELKNIFNYPGQRSVKVGGWPKQHFWFGHHTDARPMQHAEQLMFETFQLPIGPDVHMRRADSDAYLVTLFPKYGVDYVERTKLEEFEAHDRDVEVRLVSQNTDRRVRAKMVLDASGHDSFFALRYGLRDKDARLFTNTRGIFSHFRHVARLEDVLGGPHPEFRFRRDAGTVHHCFPGGWFWVIRFDDDTTSVGLMLDRKMYPRDPKVSAEEELRATIDRFPTVKAHLGKIEATRKLVSTDRVQFTCSSILGDGFILAPHAAGFVEPLFSSGFLLTIAFITRFVPVVRDLLRSPDYSPKRSMEAFRPLEKAFFTELEQVDRIVSGMIASYSSFDVFKQYWRLWISATFLQYVTRLGGDAEKPDQGGLYGASAEFFRRTTKAMHETVLDEKLGEEEKARKLKAIMDDLPKPNSAVYDLGSKRPVVIGPDDNTRFQSWLDQVLLLAPEIARSFSMRRLQVYALRAVGRQLAMKARYALSRLRGDDFHRSIDFINAIRIPGNQRDMRKAQAKSDPVPPTVSQPGTAQAAQSSGAQPSRQG
jgi:FADH2 O2-dependent halogenase